MRRRTAFLSATSGFLFALSGCGGGEVKIAEDPVSTDVATAGSSSSAASVGPSPTSDGDAVFAEYWERFATGQPAQFEQAAELAAPNSIAYGYAMNRAHIADTQLDYGYEVAEDSLELDGETATLCQIGEADDCAEFSDFKTKGGKPASFTVEGKSIADRLIMGNGSKVASAGLVDFELLSAYQSVQTDSLLAVFRIYSRSRLVDLGYVAKYRAPDGRQLETLDSYLPSSLAPKSNQLALVMFPRAEVGGDFILKWATRDDGQLVVEEATIPSRRG